MPLRRWRVSRHNCLRLPEILVVYKYKSIRNYASLPARLFLVQVLVLPILDWLPQEGRVNHEHIGQARQS
jgi:hypothetical protein